MKFNRWSFPLLMLMLCAVCVAPAQAFTPNYAEALQKSLYFYDAEKSGPGITGGRLTWRGDSELVDMAVPLYEKMPNMDQMYTNMSAEFIQKNIAILDPDGDGTVDVSGGYHDAGDHVKFGLPQTYSSSALEWALYEFKGAFVRIGEYDHMVELLRWFSDYYLRSTFRDEDGNVVAFCYQVGEGSVDHVVWAPPELIDHEKQPRPAYFATAEAPACDQTAGAAASLALTYLNSREDDSAYAEKCLDTAKALYRFAKTNYPKFQGDEAHKRLGYSGGFYGSGHDEDELAWAAVWLHIATGENAYLEDIFRKDTEGHYTGWLKQIIKSDENDWQNIWVYCWEDKWGGVFAKLAPITNDPRDWEIFRWNLEYWSGVPHQDSTDGNYLNKTGAGFSYINSWGSARYNAAAQFMGMIYKKYAQGNSDIFDAWMINQMDYIMGKNPDKRSLIVGYGGYFDNYAEHPHHRAAHGSSTNSMFDPPKHRHILWGALVGGPEYNPNAVLDPNDEDQEKCNDITECHKDKTSDFICNEVAVDYNAGLVGALAGFVTYFGQDHQPLSDFPPVDPPVKEFNVEAKIEQVNTERSQLTIRVTNESAFPPRKEIPIMVRYFFNISEITSFGQDISDVRIGDDPDGNKAYYDLHEVYTGEPVIIAGPLEWDTEAGIYYLDLRWPDSGFYGSRELQFAIIVGQDSNWQSHWDVSNDFSFQGLGSEYTETQFIPLYVEGEKYSGLEPSGTPQVTPSPRPTPSPTSTPTPTPTPAPTSDPDPTSSPTPTPDDSWTGGCGGGCN